MKQNMTFLSFTNLNCFTEQCMLLIITRLKPLCWQQNKGLLCRYRPGQANLQFLLRDTQILWKIKFGNFRRY